MKNHNFTYRSVSRLGIGLARNGMLRTGLTALLIAWGMTTFTFAADGLAAAREARNCQKRDLHREHVAEVKSINAAYRDAMKCAAADRRAAVRLCEPYRRAALEQIRIAQREAGESYRRDLECANREYRMAVAQTDDWYAAARSARKYENRYAVPINVTTPHYVVEKTTTYTIPSQVQTTQMQTVQYGSPQPAPNQFYGEPQTTVEYQTTSPTVVEGSAWDHGSQFVDGQVIEGPVVPNSSFDGQVIEGPVMPNSSFEGQVIEGSQIVEEEGTLEPIPAPGVSYRSTSRVIPVRTPLARNSNSQRQYSHSVSIADFLALALQTLAN